MSMMDRPSGSEQAARPSEDQMLLDLKAELSALTTKYPPAGLRFGGGVAQAQEQIPIICQNINDAIRALDTGVDRYGNPITKRQITDGLKCLVEATRNPAFVGLMTVALDSNGIERLEHHMSELERIADRISRPDWIVTPEKQADHMSIILEWCKRHQEKVVNVNVVSFIGEAHETTLSTAQGPIRSIEEHPQQKGVYRLEFDSQKQREPYDFLMLGFEVSGADDQGNRLVIQKGHNQRIELETQEKAETAEAHPKPGQGAQYRPTAYTFWRGDVKVGRVELAGGLVFTSDGTQQAQIYSDGSGSNNLGSGSEDGDIYCFHRQIYLKKVGRIDENGEISSLGMESVVGRVEPTPIPSDVMSVICGAALVLFLESLPVPEKPG